MSTAGPVATVDDQVAEPRRPCHGDGGDWIVLDERARHEHIRIVGVSLVDPGPGDCARYYGCVTVPVAGPREGHHMDDLDALDKAVGHDLSSLVTPTAQSIGRLVVVLILAYFVLKAVRRVIRRVDDNRLREQLLFFVPKLIGLLVVILGLAAIGIDVSGMAAIMATVGFTGAVVFTPVGQNLVAGAMIRIDDIYQVGEAVTVGDLHGHVVYRSMLRTELLLPDGSTAWVPNSSFQENQVLNHSRMGGWRICVQVPLDRASDRVSPPRSWSG